MSSQTSSPTILANGFSHIGTAKSRYYEDRLKFGTVTTKGGLAFTLGIVADGIGGENAGERAATFGDEVKDDVVLLEFRVGNVVDERNRFLDLVVEPSGKLVVCRLRHRRHFLEGFLPPAIVIDLKVR